MHIGKAKTLKSNNAPVITNQEMIKDVVGAEEDPG